MNKRKILVLAMSLCVVAILMAGATLAYFTDTDEATNVFTVGDVSVEIVEKMQDVNSQSTLVDWEEHQLTQGGLVYKTDSNGKYVATAGGSGSSWLNKLVFVKNTGSNDAYIRFKVSYERCLENVLHVAENYETHNYGTWSDAAYEEIDGIEYVTYTYIPTKPVAAGKYFGPSGLDAAAEPTYIANVYKDNILDMVWLDTSFDWVNREYGWFSYGNGDNKMVVMNDYGAPKFEVLVSVDAIQADTFTSAEAAFAAFDQQN